MSRIDLLQGTLDLLILRVLSAGDQHGWGIADRLKELSDDALQLGEGSLYTALYRMEDKGWIKAEWAQSDNNRKAKYYSLTKAGRKQLETERAEWERLTEVIAGILKNA